MAVNVHLLLLVCFALSFGIVLFSMSEILTKENILNPRGEHSSIYLSDLDTKLRSSLRQTAAEKVDISTPNRVMRPACFDENNSNIRTCRYDEVGQYLEESAKFTMIHKHSDAVPASRRIPSNQVNNKTYIAERRSKGPKDGSLTPLVEYNPTLVPLTSDLDPALLDFLTGRYHDDISDEESDKVKYLSVARGSNLHNCGGGMRKMNNPTKEYSYLSLSLLDSDLQPIPGASAFVNLAQAVLPPNDYKKLMLSPFQDFQIIAARTTKGNDKKDQLFVVTSDVKTYIFPIDIRRVPAPTNDVFGWKTKLLGKPVEMIVKNETMKHHFYGRGLQVRLMENNFRGYRKNIRNVLRSNVFDFQKNYHVYEAEQNGVVNTFMEIRPHGMRTVRKINFFAEKFHQISDWELIPNGTINKNGHRGEEDIMWAGHSGEDQWKYPFPEKTKWKGGKKPRGTACCIDLEWGTNETVKVGISHAVSQERGYVSRLYAFETKSPRFKTVAVSGPFCLGKMSEHDINAETQIFPFADRGNLNVGNETYDCPHIGFASGLVEYQADTNYAVLSYGINDCYSRSIVISKDRIREFLDVGGFRQSNIHHQ